MKHKALYQGTRKVRKTYYIHHKQNALRDDNYVKFKENHDSEQKYRNIIF
jgi:hypothetical protein